MSDNIYKYFGRNPVLNDNIGVDLTWECYKDRVGGADLEISLVDLDPSDDPASSQEWSVFVYDDVTNVTNAIGGLAPKLSDIPDDILYNCYEGNSSGEVSGGDDIDDDKNYNIFQDNFVGDASKSCNEDFSLGITV
jgi:hypothetical protein